MSTWCPDEQSAQAETMVVERIARHWNAVTYTRSSSIEYDVCYILPHGTKRTCEIKSDFKAEQTNNVYFEIENTAKMSPSGLKATNADVWAHYIPHVGIIFLFDPKALLWYLNVHRDDALREYIRLSSKCSGDNNSQGYIVSLPFLQQLKWCKQIGISA